MKLRRQSENKKFNRTIQEEVGTNTQDLDHFLGNIGKIIGETGEHIIHEIQNLPESEEKPVQMKTKPRRSLKKR